jgi:predicted RNA-binding Zn ribbon-like protein
MDNLNFSAETLFAGGWLCLDFVNTRCQKGQTELEFLGSADDLRGWLGQAEDLYGKRLRVDENWTAEHGAAVLSKAVELRAALREFVDSAIDKRSVASTAVETVNAVLRATPASLQIVSGGSGFSETIVTARSGYEWLTAIAEDAVGLFCHADLTLLRQCAHPTCIRVFYDTTKNHRRRWCVEKCGSHSKAAAYYRRKVAKAAGTASL